MAYATTEKKSRGNDGAVESVESQHQAFPSCPQPLGNRCCDFHIPTAPTTISIYTLISVDRCRPLRPLSRRQRRFAPIVSDFASESRPASDRNPCPTWSESAHGNLFLPNRN